MRVPRIFNFLNVIAFSNIDFITNALIIYVLLTNSYFPCPSLIYTQVAFLCGHNIIRVLCCV